ncbi:MAG: replicative DNA helicase [Alphaproteobacteria bacterium]
MATRPSLEAVATPEGGLAPYREPPHNVEAEQALLGALLLNNEAYNRVSDFLLAEHFYLPVHGRIYGAIGRLIDRGQIANPITLKHMFEADEGLSEAGGAQYLARLAGAAVTIINAQHYARTIHDLALRRALIRIGEETVLDAYEAAQDSDAIEQIETVEQKLFRLAEQGLAEAGFKSFTQSAADAISHIEAAYKHDHRLVGVTSGLVDLDELLGGLHPSDLLILAGRPGMGKSALATTIAYNAARAYRAEKDELGRNKRVDGAVVGFFSLEMSADQIATRILAQEARIPSIHLRRGKITTEDFHRVVRASQEIERLPLFIDDTPQLTIPGLRARARRLKRQHDLSLIIIDYLQLMRPTESARLNNRVQEISEITQGLKALAKELNLPVIALSQLSRAVEARDDKRPQLADLRESGSIEQDADVVMFIYREAYYQQRREPDPEDAAKHAEWRERMDRIHRRADLIVAKQRHGPTDTIELDFDYNHMMFGNRAREEDIVPSPGPPPF